MKQSRGRGRGEENKQKNILGQRNDKVEVCYVENEKQ